MIMVKVKSKEHAFTIPVPYTVLRLGSGILTSKLVHRRMKDWLSNKKGIELVLSILDKRSTKQSIKKLIKELQRCKGTVLVDVRAQDGTEVLIRL
ncbi:hypothetical protein [Paenibacillus sp. OV219]|uniref:hypothetical protein n=1 Tax=Paenibacillus sp. OV219 TaxID=1884377 RepID=UPI0008C2C46E|nr:hypothetical protein [Paenibacillus sp. OV219]SEN97392.1 hypothetical protein SAMN05518847_105123 [Paenibacillus sp. OV219]